MASRFHIPVCRFEAYPEPYGYAGPAYDGIEKHPANTPAILISNTTRGGQVEYEVEPYESPRHAPKHPRVRVTTHLRHMNLSDIYNVTRLALCPIGDRILLQVDAHRQQMTMTDHKGIVHAVTTASMDMANRTPCDTYFKDNTPVVTAVPTCKECLEEKLHWRHFYVQPYVHPKERKKVIEKEAAKARAYARQPSVFDKLLVDAFLEPEALSPPKTPFVLDPETVDETEDYVRIREEKVRTRAASAQKFKIDKEALKTEIKAARRSR